MLNRKSGENEGKQKMNRVRIIKADAHNFGVQVYREIKNRRDKTSRYDWVTEKFYGHRLDHAIKFATLYGIPDGETVTPELFAELMQTTITETKKALQP